ncbi:uncharacterized mitochondrial protein AtMg00810-like [Rutidosis leptorrhynchoides]|uniref:uncharacterized mitochondrial protein AtMg00810-like n=1 Tax=Rutidosis leptorrhynchoides TaxID=125765 RepID=UPI003A98D43E
MSMLEELHFFLGLEVKQLSKGIFIGQSKYIPDMFKKFNFFEMKISPTLMSINISLHADLDGQPFDQTLYRSLIGSLMYLTASGPDIMFASQLLDYGFKFHKIPIYCDSQSAIAITSNPVHHSRTKHIDIRYHFIKDHVEKGNVELYFYPPKVN